jgi:peptidoglycan/xylan/chitin deacetylase (PgdA/CDA1 family)
MANYAASGRKVVYLTFDDGPNPAVTPKLLDLLKEKNVRASFFLIDTYVNETTAPIVRRIFEEGHTVGQHSGDRWLMLHSSDRLVAKLHAAADRVEVLTGHRPCPLFRPHAGWRSIPMLRGVSRLHYKFVGWGWMTWDWYWLRKRTGERVASQVLAHAAPGKIIVIHDGHHRNPRADRSYAIDATRRVIDGLRVRGYEFVALCDIWH